MAHVAVLLVMILPTGQPGSKHAAPNSQSSNLLHGPRARSTDQGCRPEAGLQRCGKEMDNKMKMGSQERRHHCLRLVHLPALRQHKVLLCNVIFYKYSSRL